VEIFIRTSETARGSCSGSRFRYSERFETCREYLVVEACRAENTWTAVPNDSIAFHSVTYRFALVISRRDRSFYDFRDCKICAITFAQSTTKLWRRRIKPVFFNYRPMKQTARNSSIGKVDFCSPRTCRAVGDIPSIRLERRE